jgi:hypothetical protein
MTSEILLINVRVKSSINAFSKMTVKSLKFSELDFLERTLTTPSLS